MTRKDDWITELHYREFLKPKLQGKDFYWEDGKNGYDRRIPH